MSDCIWLTFKHPRTERWCELFGRETDDRICGDCEFFENEDEEIEWMLATGLI